MVQARRFAGLYLGVLAVIAFVSCAKSPKSPPASVEVRADIVYATIEGEALMLDLVRPRAGNGPFPIVLCIHGGGWSAGSRTDFRELAYGMAAQGYAAASVDYRLAPKHRYPAQFDDVKSALKFLRDHAHDWNLDPDRVAAVGGSAGGHLALMLATDPAQKLRAAVSLAGPTNLAAADLSAEATNIVVAPIGQEKSKAPDAWKAASPITHLVPGTAPIFMIHGDKDPLVPYTQTTALRDACQAAGIEADLATIPNGVHGAGGTAEANAEAVNRGLRFLHAHLDR